MIDVTTFYEALGGAERAASMTAEEKADALDAYLLGTLNGPDYRPQAPPTSEAAARATIRRGSGAVFGDGRGTPPALAPLPERPALLDFFRLRTSLPTTRHHLQSAGAALAAGASEELILACLLHDLGQSIARVDHGWWGAQLVEPYVSEKVAFAIRYHQALRFYADESVGYHYPELYVRIFGEGYVPEPYIAEAHEYARNHPWYLEARMVTVFDLYAFDPDAKVDWEPFVDVVGRHFRQPEDGLGFDGSPVAHMWRSLIFPDHPL